MREYDEPELRGALEGSDAEEDGRPIGFHGALRQSRVLTWVLIAGLVALSIGALSLVAVLQG